MDETPVRDPASPAPKNHSQGAVQALFWCLAAAGTGAVSYVLGTRVDAEVGVWLLKRVDQFRSSSWMRYSLLSGVYLLFFAAVVERRIRSWVFLATLGCVGGAVALLVIDPKGIPDSQAGDWTRNGTLVWAATAAVISLAAWAWHRLAGQARRGRGEPNGT